MYFLYVADELLNEDDDIPVECDICGLMFFKEGNEKICPKCSS